MAVGSFFLCSPDCPELHFRLINSFIQPSLVGSLDAPFERDITESGKMYRSYNCPGGQKTIQNYTFIEVATGVKIRKLDYCFHFFLF